jgi:hypothetical protein
VALKAITVFAPEATMFHAPSKCQVAYSFKNILNGSEIIPLFRGCKSDVV